VIKDGIAKLRFTVGIDEENKFAEKTEASKKKGGGYYEKVDRNLGRDRRIVMWVSRSIDKGRLQPPNNCRNIYAIAKAFHLILVFLILLLQTIQRFNTDALIRDICVSHTDPDSNLHADMDEEGYIKVIHPKLMGSVSNPADPALQLWVYRNSQSSKQPIIDIDVAYNDAEEVGHISKNGWG
jgi:hypothetical protein